MPDFVDKTHVLTPSVTLPVGKFMPGAWFDIGRLTAGDGLLDKEVSKRLEFDI